MERERQRHLAALAFGLDRSRRAGRGSRRLPSLPKRTRSPGESRLAGFTKARQCDPSRRWCSVASITGSVAPRPMRRPRNRAGITLVSLTTIASPGAQQVGEGRARRDRRHSGVAPGRTTNSRAASRGAAGRSAMRSGGSSKSNRSVRMPLYTGAGASVIAAAKAQEWNQSAAYDRAMRDLRRAADRDRYRRSIPALPHPFLIDRKTCVSSPSSPSL